ncbi:MAG: YcaO-related McrA-glycine thioamidation protein [Methanomassiliicoccaceae archaeon]|jgi:ribosomal protein S12 methylthiotransferase accessory factor|nr:YcaO-related McrA-glycine thioamidation protein [Methanomassiliicoccaceae archaeon]
MHLNRCPKASADIGIRTVLPEETLRRVIPLLTAAGLEPLEDITSKDNIGIPVFSIARTNTAHGKTKFYNGKGPTPEQAKASAVMEAMERYSAELRDTDEIIYGTFDEASENGLTLDPVEMILPMRTANYYRNDVIAWCRGFELFRGEEIWVPACAVYHPYFPDGDLQLFRYHTNGIAAGNTMEEAILHAVLELVERDAWSICEHRERANADVIVDDDSMCAGLIRKFNDSGVEIYLKDLTSDIGIPTIGAAADDVRTKDPELLTIGVGTHLNPEIAAVRALTEVAQSRTTHKHGSKINAKLQNVTQEMGYDMIKKVNRVWYSKLSSSVKLSDMKRLDTPYVLDDIEVVFDNLMECGFDKVVAVDITRPEIGVPSVRMIIPGLEVSTMDPEREGPRLNRAWNMDKKT